MPSYWWNGPGYGDYGDGLSGFIASDRYVDITAFGTFFPGETQYALNRYNEMVQTTFNAAQQAAADEANRQLVQDLLNDTDPANDEFAAQLLAANPALGIQVNGQTLFGMEAAGYLASQNSAINLGLLATVTVYADGRQNVNSYFQPFSIYDDGYGNTSNVIFDPTTGNYEPFDPANQSDRVRAAVSYAQKAQEERARGNHRMANYYEQLSRFFQVTPEERVGLVKGMRIERWAGTYMSAPTEAEQELAMLLQRRALTLAFWAGANIDNPNTISQQALVYYNQYQTSRPGDWMLNRPRNVQAMGQTGLQNATAVGGFISFVNTVLNTVAIANRTTQLQTMDREIERVRMRVVQESTYIVPPRPNEVDAFMQPLRNVLSPADYNRALSEMNNLSAAFWGANP